MKTTKALLVDDDTTSREGIAGYLRDVAKFSVKECTSGQTALDELRTNGDAYQVVLLDWLLGGEVSGEQVLEVARRTLPALPIVVFTGNAAGVGPVALGSGAYRCLEKPVDLNQLVAEINSLSEQDASLRNLADTLCGILQSDACLVWKFNRHTRQFHLAGWSDGSQLVEEDRSITLSADDPIIRQLLDSGEPCQLRNVQESPKYQHAKNAKRHEWMSLVTIPLVHRGQPIGLLDSYTLKPWTFPKGQERRIKDMLKAFANQTAEAINNAEAARQSQVRQELSRLLIGPLDLDAVLQVILSSGLEAVCAHAGWLYLSDSTNTDNRLRRVATQGEASEWAARELNLQDDLIGSVKQGGTARVIRDSAAVLLGDAQLGNRYPSRIAVPLRREEQTVGVLVAASQFPNVFSHEDIGVLGSFAQLEVMAVNRAKLMEHMRNVSESALGSREALAESVVSAVHDLTGRGVCWWEIDPKYHELRIRASRGVSPTYKGLPPIKMSDEALATYALSEKVIINHPDILNPEAMPKLKYLEPIRKEPMAVSKFKYREAAKEAGIRGVLAIPLFGSEKQPLGTLHIYRGTIGEFSSTEEDLVAGFANQVALAVEGQQRAALQDVFVEVSRQLATSKPVELPDVLHSIVNGALRLTATESGVVHVVDSSGTKIIASHWFPEATEPQPLPKMAPNGYTRQIIEKKEQRIVEDAQDERLYPQVNPDVRKAGIRSFVGTPLIHLDGRVIGVLYVNSYAARKFTSSELELLLPLAGQAAVAIENARQTKLLAIQKKTREGIHVKDIEDVEGILDILYSAAGEAIDLSNAQVQFAFYDNQSEEVSFPLAVENDEEHGGEIDRVHMGRREVKYRESDEDEWVKQLLRRSFNDRVGLTEYVIHTKRTIPIPCDFQRTAENLVIDDRPLFVVGLDCVAQLDAAQLPERLHMGFAEHSLALGEEAHVEVKREGSQWVVTGKRRNYLINNDGQLLTVYSRVKVWPTFGRLDRPTRSWLGVPMVAKDRVLGIISIQSLEEENAFGEEEVQLLSDVANHAAVAIEKAWLYGELRRAKERVVAAERRAITNRFAEEFAHELTSVAGTTSIWIQRAEQALQDAPVAAQVSSYLQLIERDVDNLYAVAEKFKDSLRMIAPESMNEEWVILEPFIRDMIAKVRPAVPQDQKQYEEELICTSKDLSVRVVKYDLTQVVSNVIRNAFEAMPNGGSLRIDCGIVPQNERSVVRMAVTDTGIGIPKNERERIFEPFFSTKERMGYGLWDARTILEAMGGSIRVVDSEVGKGTTFGVYLPCEFRTETSEVAR